MLISAEACLLRNVRPVGPVATWMCKDAEDAERELGSNQLPESGSQTQGREVIF